MKAPDMNFKSHSLGFEAAACASAAGALPVLELSANVERSQSLKFRYYFLIAY